MSSARAAFRASRADMMQAGVPVDYVDALLDDRYMAELIERTNRRMAKRAEKMSKHLLMQKIVFWVLVAQAVLGLWVALYKTWLQPDVLLGSVTNLENVDMVFMLDASEQMKFVKSIQHSAVINLSGKLKKAMLDHNRNIESAEEAKLAEKSGGGGLLSFLRPRPPEGMVSVMGGSLRVATGIFNAQNTTLLHGFTGNLEEQRAALASVRNESYGSVAFWLPALETCKQAARDAGPGHVRYCAIIGDDQAMCHQIAAKEVVRKCQQWPGFCPPEEDMGTAGDGFLEFRDALDVCTEYVGSDLHPPPASLKPIMLFTVGSDEEGQSRLANRGLRSFIKEMTDCDIVRKQQRAVSLDGHVSVNEWYEEEDECVRFIMAKGIDELMNKSARIADLLKGSSKNFTITNEGHDPRYSVFALLPLNLLFFLASSSLLRCYDRVRTRAERAMGTKKKVIKVTKFLVEKPEAENEVAQRRAQLSEVELSEMASLQPLVEFGAPMLLRARLKGAYLCAHGDTPEGNGKASDHDSNWTFEPVGRDSDGSDGCGRVVRIRNARGELLVADGPGGTRFAPAPSDEDAAAALGKAVEFVLEQAAGGENCRLGDTCQIRSCGTGKYLRVQKDGSCDAEGTPEEHETQFVIDRGGAGIGSGAIVTLASMARGAFMSGLPDGAVSAEPGGEEWRYWKIDRREGGAAGSQAAHGPHLKEGDVVALTGFNQNMLEVDGAGRATCGGSSSSLAASNGCIPEDAEAPAGAPAGGVQEFVIERVGMGLVKKHDNVIRAGMQISLRPLRRDGRGGDPQEGQSDFLSVHGDGSVGADGKPTQPEIAFMIEIASVKEMVMPLHRTLQKGDVDILVSPLWSKSDVKRLKAMTANWTKDEDLGCFKGPVVVASAEGKYSPPTKSGVQSGWVAVVNEGVDLPKAARQAKLQGAIGLIVRSEDAVSLDHIGRRGKQAVPELPTIFVDKTVGEALDERGIVLNGCEFRRHYVTDVMRALGAAEDGDEVFRALGKAHLERRKERIAEAEAEAQAEAAASSRVVEEEQEGQYKWKTTSNTHYLWGKSGGGASKMDVNFGKAAPPSAVRNTKVYADASERRLRRTSTSEVRRSVTGVAVLEPEAITGRHFVTELSQVLTTEEASASEAQEQLSEESDFKLEYKFEEIEVASGEQLEDIEEEELMEEQEAVVRKIGVPKKMFWLVLAGLALSTVLLMAIMWYGLCTKYTPPHRAADEGGREDLRLDAGPARVLPPRWQQDRPGSFLAVV